MGLWVVLGKAIDRAFQLISSAFVFGREQLLSWREDTFLRLGQAFMLATMENRWERIFNNDSFDRSRTVASSSNSSSNNPGECNLKDEAAQTTGEMFEHDGESLQPRQSRGETRYWYRFSSSTRRRVSLVQKRAHDCPQQSKEGWRVALI